MSTETAINDLDEKLKVPDLTETMLDEMINSLNTVSYSDNTNYLHVGDPHPWGGTGVIPNHRIPNWTEPNIELEILKAEIAVLRNTIENLEDQLREERERVTPSELSDAKKALEELL